MAFTKLKKTQTYTDIICVGLKVDSKPYQFSDKVYHENIHGYHTHHIQLRKGQIKHDMDFITWDNSDLFSCITNYIPTGRNSLIVCNHSLVAIGASDFTTLLDNKRILLHHTSASSEEFGYEEYGKISTEAFIASCPPTILIFKDTNTGKTYTLVDIANYGAKYMQDIWNNLSNEEKSTIHNEAELGVDSDNSLTCCALISLFMTKYIKLVNSHSLGGLSLTYSSQGMRCFRSKFYQDNILTHTDDEARIIEDRCYLGGRVDERYNGKYDGKVYLLDIQSLYPHLGKIKPFPTKLKETKTYPSKRDVEEGLRSGIVAAHCHIETDLPAYPVKTDAGLVFPVGKFNAYLIGDEFTDAWREGRVKSVYSANFYESDFILKEYSEYMLSLRTKYKGANSRLEEFMIKCITNGLWGKFGQCGNMWVNQFDEIADMPYGGFYRMNSDSTKKYQYRIIDWNVSKLEYAPWANNTFVPISACMNSYSRHYIWRHMLQAGLHNVLYTCVDGLIVTQEGYDRLAWLVAPNPYIYGMYKVSESGDSCYIAGYGKYQIGNKTAYQGLPRHNVKQYRGFWSAIESDGNQLTDNVIKGKEVLATYCSKDLRDSLRTVCSQHGSFTGLARMDEPILPYRSHNPLEQGFLWHDSEWNQ